MIFSTPVTPTRERLTRVAGADAWASRLPAWTVGIGSFIFHQRVPRRLPPTPGWAGRGLLRVGGVATPGHSTSGEKLVRDPPPPALYCAASHPGDRGRGQRERGDRLAVRQPVAS